MPLALAILVASGQLDAETLRGVGAAGELALDGSVRPIPGVLAMAQHARQAGWRALMVPASLAAEARLVEGLEVLPVRGLRHAAELLRGDAPAGDRGAHPIPRVSAPGAHPNLRDVRGQGAARRALEVAAAGRHSMLMLGPPGSGKTMLARCLPGILPSLGDAEMLEVTRIHSAAGLLDAERPVVRERPFRAPHHTISRSGLVGGGRVPSPGELTLAHRGVLFLDEVCAFAPATLDALRQPLEEGHVRVTRAMLTHRFPARPLLVCAGNPCPCGFAGDVARTCTCAPARLDAYRGRLSGPVIDRIDIWVEMGRLSPDELSGAASEEPSESVRGRVEAGERFRASRGQDVANAEIPASEVRERSRLSPGATALARRAVDELALSGRGYDRLLKVSRTIADLAESERVDDEHLSEALGLRRPAVAS